MLKRLVAVIAGLAILTTLLVNLKDLALPDSVGVVSQPVIIDAPSRYQDVSRDLSATFGPVKCAGLRVRIGDFVLEETAGSDTISGFEGAYAYVAFTVAKDSQSAEIRLEVEGTGQGPGAKAASYEMVLENARLRLSEALPDCFEDRRN